MGLNDTFLTDDSMETKPPVVKVNALKNTAPGEQPELNDKVDLIAFDEQWEDEERQAQNDAAALEELHIRAADLQFLHENLLSFKGMSQQIALECQKILPDFISESRPLASYSSQLTAVGYKAALEEVDQEKKGLGAKLIDFIKKVAANIAAWLKRILSRRDPKKQKEKVEKVSTVKPEDISLEKVAKASAQAEAKESGKPAPKEVKPVEQGDLKKALVIALKQAINEKQALDVVVIGSPGFEASIKKINEVASGVSNSFSTAMRSSDEKRQSEFLERIKAMSDASAEFDKEFASNAVSGDEVYEKLAEGLMKLHGTIYAKEDHRYAALGPGMHMPEIENMLEAMSNYKPPEGGAVVKNMADGLKECRHFISIMVRISESINAYCEMTFNYFDFRNQATESMDLPPGAENAYNSPLMNVSGGYVAAGAEPPTPGGFAEYYFGVKQAEVLAGSLNPDGSVVVSPRTTLIARIATLQEALKNLDAGMQPSLESIDILSEKLRPREALAFSSKALAGKVPRAEFEKEMAASNVQLAKELTNSAAAMASGVAEIDEMSAMIKKFGIFGKPPAREATAEDIEKLMKIADAYQCGVVGFLGQPVQKPLMWNFAKAATRMHRADVFNSRAFWPAVDELEKARFALFDKLDRELLDDHAAAAKLLADGLLGTPKDFFAHADEIYSETASSCRVINTTVERDIKRYIAIAEKNGYENDLKYFNQVLNVYEVTVKLLVFLARCCFTFNSIRKDFKV